MKKTKYFFDNDCDGHWYLIDANFRQEWNEWLGSDEPETPEFVTRLGGGIFYHIEFENPIIDGIPLQKEGPEELLTFLANIEAWLSFNQEPTKVQLQELKTDIIKLLEKHNFDYDKQ